MSEVSIVRRPAVVLAFTVTLVLALAAFTLSFVVLADLAERSGIPGNPLASAPRRSRHHHRCDGSSRGDGGS